ncbi:MAG: response regulator [Planctomycetota bacterium]|jgi:CheY-like chemotaxis protein
MPRHILIADDQDDARQALVALLQGMLDARIEVARDGSEALRQLLDQPFDLSLLDVHMPGLTGLEVLDQLKQAGSAVPSILMTGHPSREIEMAAMDLGVVTMLRKPIPAEILRITVQQILSPRPDGPGPADPGQPW